MNNEEIFVDQISNIYVNGNMVRIDFVCLNPATRDQSGQPLYSPRLRLIIPMEGFTNGLSLQENILAQLVENGVLKQPPSPPVESE
ncbi:MAG: hypothetical protein P4N59_32315 [Negativicutes bacterium]|nr:hypothetical protein [Negativicutes bacterium]